MKKQYQLPQKIERYLATLAKLYAQEGKRDREAILVNASSFVKEEWSYDNWDGGIAGHALYLTIPELLYLSSARRRKELQEEIKNDLNKIHTIQSEFIEEVFLEMEDVEDQDWRKNSGLLQAGPRRILPTAEKRIWKEGEYRVFLSHKTEVKQQTSDLKKGLSPFGIHCFVAHEDVSPTKEWQDEIENALGSMDAFVALMTDGFHDSLWTDQEVGFALARGVPLIAVKLGKDPYGFIGKFQALPREWSNTPIGIAQILIKQPRMLAAYIAALPKCRSFEEGITLSQVFPYVDDLTPEQADAMVLAVNNSHELRFSWGFNGAKPNLYGNGLAPLLTRLTGDNYFFQENYIIEKGKN